MDAMLDVEVPIDERVGVDEELSLRAGPGFEGAIGVHFHK